jgi:ElaA protein
MVVFKCKPFNSLNIDELHSILALRSEVFVVEQNCVYQDIDGKDKKALHIIGYSNEEIVAYARIFDKGVIYPEYCSIGRIATSFTERGKKFGHQLVEFSIKQSHKSFNSGAIKISAQAHLEKFYGLHGFRASGETYLEDGIPHVGMLLPNSF